MIASRTATAAGRRVPGCGLAATRQARAPDRSAAHRGALDQRTLVVPCLFLRSTVPSDHGYLAHGRFHAASRILGSRQPGRPHAVIRSALTCCRARGHGRVRTRTSRQHCGTAHARDVGLGVALVVVATEQSERTFASMKHTQDPGWVGPKAIPPAVSPLCWMCPNARSMLLLPSVFSRIPLRGGSG